ncbi:deaminase [Pseudactinotalea sp. HY160]|uniref:dihydrofolate reductase family protein n=1 Tax=Pseudactinotalea sp. HY160 TaxID=2654490 RepID=UPI00128DB5B1|nr:dihydrofolate reductase family protein [Pseudactinotalea sp. HY160]MPV50639.1 deaminase [Pseudactinotalea sp. HY160]
MAGTFVYWMNVSLDLRIEHAAGESGGGDWLRIDESLHRVFNERARELVAMVQGRVVYEIMEGFWPRAADDASAPEYLREYGRIWTSAPKVLVSRTRTEAGHNTRVIGSDAIERLAELRETSEGPIGIGGATIATQVLEANLLDELVLFTHPAILGAGRPLFDRMPEPLGLDLLEERACSQGVVLHRYAVRKRP